MINVYTKGMTRKTKQSVAWLNQYDLDYQILSLAGSDFTYEIFLKALSLTDMGVYDLIAKRSKEYEELKSKVDIDSLSIKGFYQLLLENPGIINQPIILNDNKLSLGFKEEDISVFLPRHLRGKSMVGRYE